MDDRGRYILGCRAALSLHISYLTHEMAHLAEREIPKLLERPNRNWGFSLGTYWEVMGKSGYQHNTDQAIRREMRVLAYQWSFMQHYGIRQPRRYGRHSLLSVVKPSERIDSYIHFKYNPEIQKKIAHLEYEDGDARALEFFRDEIKELAHTKFTFEAFCDAWSDRMKALKNSTI